METSRCVERLHLGSGKRRRGDRFSVWVILKETSLCIDVHLACHRSRALDYEGGEAQALMLGLLVEFS